MALELHTPLISRIDYQLEGGPVDCEALMVDAANQRVILITKVLFGAAGIYELDLSPWLSSTENNSNRDRVLVAERIGETWVNAVTGGDISPDGTRMVVSTYGPAWEWVRGENETWEDALQDRPVRIDIPRRRQGESICYSADGQAIIVSSEGRNAPLYKVQRSD